MVDFKKDAKLTMLGEYPTLTQCLSVFMVIFKKINGNTISRCPCYTSIYFSISVSPWIMALGGTLQILVARN